jgi:hypothetical protein
MATTRTTTKTSERVRRVQGIRGSNAAGPHATGRTRREADRGKAQRNAIRESE